MTDWDERDFRPEEEEVYEVPPPQRPSSPFVWSLWAAIALVVVLGALFLYQRTRPLEPTEPERVPVDETVRGTNLPSDELLDEEPPSPALPPLSESDAFVRALLQGLTAHPALTTWFLDEGLVRKAVAVVVNVAEGEDPARHFRHLAPEDPFDVVRRQEALYVDPLSYRRYDGLAAGIASVDAERIAHLYRKLEPLLVQAYRELGYLEQPFEATLTEAIEALLRTPIVDGRVEVHAVSVNYAFSDPNLERLQPAQKLLLRMGPSNVETIQSKLREISQSLALGI